MDGNYWVCQECGACNDYEQEEYYCYNCGCGVDEEDEE